MKDPNDVKFVAAIEDADGTARFRDDLTPFRAGPNSPSVKFWRFEGADALIPASVGGVPTDNRFTGPGGATFQLVRFPAHFLGVTAEELRRANPSVQLDDGDDPEMHSTDTIDMGFVVSGKVDLKLPGDQVRTLSAGSAFVIAGARHAWANPYDEPCAFSNVIVGVAREGVS
ncbi:MAG TPA: cupin domain-containing protein [Acidimicrobiales bacterium]|nr:cupin domain-containing protein [Acidimicrobiales bacterium]